MPVPVLEVLDMFAAPVEVLAARGGRGRTIPLAPGVGRRLVFPDPEATVGVVGEMVFGVVACGAIDDDA